jgi:hypothetical protein
MPHLANALAYAWLPCSAGGQREHDHRGSRGVGPHRRRVGCHGTCCMHAWLVPALTRMSSAHMRLSKGSDSLNFSISGSVLPVNRPPHSFLVPASSALACVQCSCSSRACWMMHRAIGAERAAGCAHLDGHPRHSDWANSLRNRRRGALDQSCLETSREPTSWRPARSLLLPLDAQIHIASTPESAIGPDRHHQSGRTWPMRGAAEQGFGEARSAQARSTQGSSDAIYWGLGNWIKWARECEIDANAEGVWCVTVWQEKAPVVSSALRPERPVCCERLARDSPTTRARLGRACSGP